MNRVTRIGHVGIAVSDLDRALDFYVGQVGLELTERFEYPEEEIGHGTAVAAGAFVRCDPTHHCMSIFSLKNPPRGEIDGHPFGLHHIAFEMATPEQLLGKHADMKEAGVPIVGERMGGPGNQPRFYARDPDGNLLEFYWGIDQIGWNGEPRPYPPIEDIELRDFDFEAYEQRRSLPAVPEPEKAD